MTVTRAIGLVSVIAAVALATCGSQPMSANAAGVKAAAATPRPLVGVNLHLFFRGPALAPGERHVSVSEGRRMVDRAARSGADLVRVAVGWPLLEPVPGHLDADYLAFIDQVLVHARRRHVRVVLVWGGVLCGYGGLPPGITERCETQDQLRSGSRYYPESDFAVGAYADRAAWLVARHSKTIVAIEPTNEPNHRAFLQNPGGPLVAAKVTRATYGAVKRTSPRVQVLLGALAGADADYLERLYGAGVSGHFDAVSLRPTTSGSAGRASASALHLPPPSRPIKRSRRSRGSQRCAR